MRTLVLLLVTTTVAAAKELTVNEQEQINIQAICDVASTNPNVSRDIRASIAAFCVQWAKQTAPDKDQQQSQTQPLPQK
jgi:hypothetical protein